MEEKEVKYPPPIFSLANTAPNFSWCIKKNSWYELDSNEAKDLETAYHNFKANGPPTIKVGDHTFNFQTFFTAEQNLQFMRVCKTHTPYPIPDMNTSPETYAKTYMVSTNEISFEADHPTKSWSYCFLWKIGLTKDYEDVSWALYDNDENLTIERGYKEYLEGGKEVFKVNEDRTVNFKDLVQYRSGSGKKTRRIYFAAFKWFWVDSINAETKIWKEYSPEQTHIIEKAYRENESQIDLTLKIDNTQNSYIINFLEMCQFNQSNRFKRREIIRVGAPLIPSARSKVLLKRTNSQMVMVLSIPPPYWIELKSKEDFLELEPSNQNYKKIFELMNSTIATHIGDYGLVPGLSPAKVEPKFYRPLKILQIQSDNLWQRYSCQRVRITLDGNVPSSELSSHLKKYPLKTPLLDSSVNEAYLFHGTTKHVANIIRARGFDTRHGSELVTHRHPDGMFGNGVYFAEHFSKSNQYVGCPICNGNSIGKNRDKECKCSPEAIETAGGYVMIIGRVLLGDGHVCKEYTEANYKHKEKAPMKPDGSSYDSIFAETRNNFPKTTLRYREFVIFQPEQIYPEFLVYYMRHAEKPQNLLI